MGIRYNTSIVRNGLVLHLDAANVKSYPGSGTTWYDLSGNGNHGTLVNGPTFDSANKGCLSFDGTNDYVVGNISSYSSAEYTSTTWVFLNTVAPEQHLTNLKGSVQFYVKAGTLGSASFGNLTGGIINATTWYMLTQRRASDGTGSIFINGDFISSSALPAPGAVTQYVVGNYVGGGNYWLNGKIGVSKIYNRALSASEIKQNFEALRGRYSI